MSDPFVGWLQGPSSRTIKVARENLERRCSRERLVLHVTTGEQPMETTLNTPVKERVSRRRAALRAAGMRPVQIWVPDTRMPGFAEECRRQSGLLRGDRTERERQRWIEQAADTEGWE